MQLLSVVVALVALGFTFTLSRSRRGSDRYGIVLIVLPLALVTPLVALMASGLQLIYGYRGAGSGEGLEALVYGVQRALYIQYDGHRALLALLGALALVAVGLLVSRQEPSEVQPPSPDPNEDSEEAKPLSKYAIPLMAAAVVVCIAAVGTLSEFEDRWVAAPVALLFAFDANDVSEFSPNQREVDDQRRRGSNALVIETFRTLVVVVLFLILFDAFLVGSRAATFTRGTLILSLALIVVASAVSFRAFSRHREFVQTIEERLSSIEKAKPEPEPADAEETESTEPPS